MDKLILYLDTCVLLDMIRDPTRDDIHVHEHEASKVLLRAVNKAKAIEVCIAEQVELEFRDRIESVQTEARNKLKELEQKVKKVDDLFSLYGLQGRVDLDHWSGYDKKCRDFVERWMDVSNRIRQSDSTLKRAFDRVNEGRSPAKKGSSQIKDCVILETCLEHLCSLRADGRKASAVFVSSNTRDYADKNRTTIRADIAQYCESLNLLSSPNMGAARGLLRV